MGESRQLRSRSAFLLTSPDTGWGSTFREPHERCFYVKREARKRAKKSGLAADTPRPLRKAAA